jgi:hypothetical protein
MTVVEGLLQLVPLYVTLTIPRDDVARLYRWRAYWCAITFVFLFLDLLGRGLLTKSVMMMVLTSDDARGAEYMMDLTWSVLKDLHLEQWYYLGIKRVQLYVIWTFAMITKYCTEYRMRRTAQVTEAKQD